MKSSIFSLAIATAFFGASALPSFTFSASTAQTNGVYPYGSEFGLGIIQVTSNWSTEAAKGWNVCHTYNTAYPSTSYTAFMNNCKNGGMLMMGKLGNLTDSAGKKAPKTESALKADIEYLAGSNNLAWWDMPEELEYWNSEMDIVKLYPGWIRKYDPKKYPIEHYIPGHYTKDQVQTYVPYFDIIPASAYPTYMGQPHTYVRWSIERTFQAVKDAGYTLGKDYLNGQKTVTSILELYLDKPGTSPEGSKHDFWLSIALDVKGLWIYSYAYRNDSQNLKDCWAALSTAVANFTGPEHLDRVMINGVTNKNVGFTVTSGPARTATFNPPLGRSGDAPVSYPSLTVLAKTYNGATYVIAVNSNTSQVTASITGLPSASTATVLFENRSVPVSGGSLSDTFAPLGVHIYKIGGTSGGGGPICTDTYTRGVAVPTGYGAAYNLLSTAQEALVKTNSCTDTSASVTIGNSNPATYVYKDGYQWTGTAWQALTYTGTSALISDVWYTGSANGTIPLTAGNTSKYYVGYTCQPSNSVWKCGCQDTACTTAAWQLQRVSKAIN